MPLPTLAEYFLQNKTLLSELAAAKLEKSFQIFETEATAARGDDDLKTKKRKASLTNALEQLPLNRDQLDRALALAEKLERKIPTTKKIAEGSLKEKGPDKGDEDAHFEAFTEGLRSSLLKNPTYDFVLSAYPWLIEDKSAPDRSEKLQIYLEEIINLNLTLKPGKEAEIRGKIKNYLTLRREEEAEKEAENSKAGTSAKPKTASPSLLLSEQIKEKIKDETTPKPIKTDNYDRVNFLIRSVASAVENIIPKLKLNFEQFAKEDFTLASFDATIAEKIQQLNEAKSDRRDIVPDSILSLEKLAKALDESSPGIRRSIKNRLGWPQEKIIAEDAKYVAAKDLFGTNKELTEANFSQFFQRNADGKFEIVPTKAEELNPIEDEASGIDAEKLNEELAKLNTEIDTAKPIKIGDPKLWSNFLMTPGFVAKFKDTDYPQIALALFPTGDIKTKKLNDVQARFTELFTQEKKESENRAVTKTAELENLLSASKKSSLPTETEINNEIGKLNAAILKAKPLASGKNWIKNIFSAFPAVKFQSQYKSIAKILKFDTEAKDWESKIKKDEFEERFNGFFEQDQGDDRAVKIKDDKKEALLKHGYVEQKESEELQKLKKFLEYLNSDEKAFSIKPYSEIVTSLKTVEMPDDPIPSKYNAILAEAQQTITATPQSFEKIFAVETVKDGEKHKLREDKRKDLVIAARNQPSPFKPLSSEVSAILTTSTTPAEENAHTLVEDFSAILSKGSLAGQLLAGDTFKTLNQLFPPGTPDEEKAKTLKSGKKLEKNLQKIWAKFLIPQTAEIESKADDSKTAMIKFVIALQEIEGYKAKDLAVKYDLDELKKAFISPNFANLYKESLFYASLEGNNKLVNPPLTSDDIALYKGFNKYYESAARVLVSSNKLSEEEANTAFEPAMGFRQAFTFLQEKADSADGKKIDAAASIIIKAHKDKFFLKIKGFHPHDYNSKSDEVTALSKEIGTINEENALLAKNSEATERALSTYFSFSGKKFQDYKDKFEGFLHLQLEGDSLPKDVLAIASRHTGVGTLDQGDQGLLAKILKLEADKEDALTKLAELGETTLHRAPSLEDSEKTALQTELQALKEKSGLEKVVYDAQKAKFEALSTEIAQLKISATSPDLLREKDAALAGAKRDLEETTSRKEAELSELQEKLSKERQLSFDLKAALAKIGPNQEVLEEFLRSSLETSGERVSILNLESQTAAMQLVNLNVDTVSRSGRELNLVVEEALQSKSLISQAKCEEEKEEFKRNLRDLIDSIARENENKLENAVAMDERIKAFIKIIENSLSPGDEQAENTGSHDLLGKLKSFVSTLAYDESASSGNFAAYAELFKGENNENLNVVFRSIDLTHQLLEEERAKSGDGNPHDEAVVNREVLEKASKETEDLNKPAIHIQRVFRGHLQRKEAEKLADPLEKRGEVTLTETGGEELRNKVVDPRVLTVDAPPPLDVDKCLKNAIALMKTYVGNRIDLSRETFGKDVKKGDSTGESEVIITLGKNEIAQLAKLTKLNNPEEPDLIRLNNSKFGGLTFDFEGAAPEDVKKFLDNTYCADFRNCTIKNLKLDKIFSDTDKSEKALEEEKRILKNFSTVKFLNCKFEGYQPTPDFRFRAENIVNDKKTPEVTLKGDGLNPETQISRPSGSPRATEIQKVAGHAKLAAVELVARGGYIPSYGPARGG